jgi:hypothetical protein
MNNIGGVEHRSAMGLILISGLKKPVYTKGI